MDDDFNLMEFFDDAEPEGNPTARGIVQCLRMLADEASSLGLNRTLAALQTAIVTCADEREPADAAMDSADAFCLGRPPGTLLH